jgi:WD40 repeat protein/serine/threonine protein kinase
MSVDDRLQDLLEHWEELHERGQTVSPEELCSDCPELIEPLRRQIRAILDMASVLDERPRSSAATTVRPIQSSKESQADVSEDWGARPRIPGYEILRELGRGGMGVVYQARQLSLGRLVALKMILTGAHAGAKELARFRTEVEAVARLEHPNIVRVYEVNEHDGQPYLALEFVDGGSLADRIDGKPQPPMPTAQLLETLASTMHAVHQQGIVHRDLKPANILLQGKSEVRKPESRKEHSGGAPASGLSISDFTVKVTDFGLAKRLDTDTGPTLSGQILGTPCYMAPEQAAGRTKQIGPATDVYSLGAILYEMLTGRPPFQEESQWETIRKVASEEPLAPRQLEPKVPLDLETVCLKCLQKEPQKRYATALALAEDLRRVQSGEPIQARPVGAWERAWKWAKRRPAAALLLAVSSLAVIAFVVGSVVYNAKLRSALEVAEAHAEESRQRLVRLQVSQGSHALDEGDWFTAVVWFAEALRLDEGQEAREEMHRRRIGVLLRRSPRLIRLWFHDGPVWHVQFSRDGRYLVTASEDRTARVWDVRSGDPVGAPLRHGAPIWHADFSPDGTQVVTAGRDGLAQVWVVATGRPLLSPLPHASPLTCAFFSPDGRSILTAAEDSTARIWDAATGKPRIPPLRHARPVKWAMFSPDGQRVVTASDDRTARVWNPATGAPVTAPLPHAGAVNDALFNSEGSRVLTASADGTARLWNARTGQSLLRPLRHHASVAQAAFSRDGRRVVTASEDQTAVVWDAETGEPVAPPLKQAAAINVANFSSDGVWVVTGSSSNAARVWDAATGEPITPLLKHSGTIYTVAFSPIGQSLLVTASNDGTARLWDLAAQQAVAAVARDDSPEPVKLSGPGRWVSPDGRWNIVAEGSRDYDAQVRDADTGEAIGPLLRHGSSVLYAAFSADGSRIVTASDDNTARVWDPRTGDLLAQTVKYHGKVLCAAFSRDNRLLVTASDDHSARVWDAGTGQPISPALLFTGVAQRASFTADGNRVSVTADKTARTWDLSPDRRPAAELLSLVQMLAGGRIDLSRGFIPLGADEMRDDSRHFNTGTIAASQPTDLPDFLGVGGPFDAREQKGMAGPAMRSGLVPRHLEWRFSLAAQLAGRIPGWPPGRGRGMGPGFIGNGSGMGP